MSRLHPTSGRRFRVEERTEDGQLGAVRGYQEAVFHQCRPHHSLSGDVTNGVPNNSHQVYPLSAVMVCLAAISANPASKEVYASHTRKGPALVIARAISAKTVLNARRMVIARV